MLAPPGSQAVGRRSRKERCVASWGSPRIPTSKMLGLMERSKLTGGKCDGGARWIGIPCSLACSNEKNMIIHAFPKILALLRPGQKVWVVAENRKGLRCGRKDSGGQPKAPQRTLTRKKKSRGDSTLRGLCVSARNTLNVVSQPAPGPDGTAPRWPCLPSSPSRCSCRRSGLSGSASPTQGDCRR